MINTSGNIICLTALLSGIHVWFLNHPHVANVTLAYGDRTMNEQFVATSDKLNGELRIYMETNRLYITITRDDEVIGTWTYTDFDTEDRSGMRKLCIDLLSGIAGID